MLKKIYVIGVILLLAMFMIGCAKTTTDTTTKKPTDSSSGAKVKVDVVPGSEPAVETVSNDLGDVVSVDDELQDKDLDTLEKDLEGLDW